MTTCCVPSTDPSCSSETLRTSIDDYSAVVQTHYARFRRVAFRILGNLEEAEDAVQQAYLQALASIHRFEGRAALSTWLMRIVTNEALTCLRRRVPSVDLDTISLRSADNPEKRAGSSQVLTIIMAGVQSLPEPYRSTFSRCVIADESASATAAQLGVTVACVKVRLHRAKVILRAKLRRQLEELSGGNFYASRRPGCTPLHRR